MTLDTRVFVLGEIDPKEVFAQCNRLLRAPPETESRESEGELENLPGQGLPAWLRIWHGNGGPLRASRNEDGEPACWLEVSFDTAYGYKNGHMRCTDLHSQLVERLGLWLGTRGIKWAFRNDLTGKVYDGGSKGVRRVNNESDRLTKLEERVARLERELGRGEMATPWFCPGCQRYLLMKELPETKISPNSRPWCPMCGGEMVLR